MAFPGHSQAAGYVQEWRDLRPRRTPYLLGWGYGADLGGLSEQPGTGADGGITYPFKSLDGRVTFERQRTGERTFDYNKDGVAHYGLYADWLADLRRVGGDPLVKDLWNGAEAYLEMWERASGVPSTRCSGATAAMGPHGLGALRVGARWEQVLRVAGQPQQRDRAWSWCVAGAGNEHAADVAELSRGGTVELVGSTAQGRRAGGAAVGDAARGRSLGAGVLTRRDGSGTTWAYATSGGRVTAVAVASRALARHADALRAAMLRVASASASQAQPAFEPSAATESTQSAAPSGQPLAGTASPQLNAALAALCSLQVGV
jgi:hypothetical protein